MISYPVSLHCIYVVLFWQYTRRKSVCREHWQTPHEYERTPCELCCSSPAVCQLIFVANAGRVCRTFAKLWRTPSRLRWTLSGFALTLPQTGEQFAANLFAGLFAGGLLFTATNNCLLWMNVCHEQSIHKHLSTANSVCVANNCSHGSQLHHYAISLS